MLIDNVLTLIEEYTAYRNLSRMVKAKKIASAPIIATPRQKDSMHDAAKKDKDLIAKEAARYIANSMVPGLGTAGIIGSKAIDFLNSSNRNQSDIMGNVRHAIMNTHTIAKVSPLIRNEKLREASEIIGAVPTKVISTTVANKRQNARTQYVLDHFKSKSDSEIQQGRVQKICAENPGLKGC